MVGELQYSMYGTRDAAQNWQEEFSGLLGKTLGLKRADHHPAYSIMKVAIFVHLSMAMTT